MTVVSGPPRVELPYRWGCRCGATWNSDQAEEPQGPLCGSGCKPKLVKIDDK